MSDEPKEQPEEQPIVANIRMGAYRSPEAESASALRRAQSCSCQGTLGKGTAGDCKCGSQSGAGSE